MFYHFIRSPCLVGMQMSSGIENAAKFIVKRDHFSSIEQKVSRSSSSLASNSVSSLAGVEILAYLPPTSHLLTCASACIWHLPTFVFVFVSAYLYFCISREVRILAGTLPPWCQHHQLDTERNSGTDRDCWVSLPTTTHHDRSYVRVFTTLHIF